MRGWRAAGRYGSSRRFAHGGQRNVSRSYRLGVQIVLGTVFISAIACWAGTGHSAALRRPAGQDLGTGALPLGDFRFTERSGRTVTAGRSGRSGLDRLVHLHPLPAVVPPDLERDEGPARPARQDERLLVSISVDPDHDTPAVLTEYARRFGASTDRWWFLTGPKSSIYDLVQNRFKLGLVETTASDRASGAEAISHSDRLALVDRGRIVGFFESSDQGALDALVARASRLAQPSWVRNCRPSTRA